MSKVRKPVCDRKRSVSRSDDIHNDDALNPYKHLEDVDPVVPQTELAALDPPAPIDPMLAGFIASVASGGIVGAVAMFVSQGAATAPAGMLGGIVTSVIAGAVSFAVAGVIARSIGSDRSKVLSCAVAGAVAGWPISSYAGLGLIERVLSTLVCGVVVLITVSRFIERASRNTSPQP